MKKTPAILVIFITSALAGAGWYYVTHRAGAGAGDDAAFGGLGGQVTVAYRSEPRTFNRLVAAQTAEDLVARLTQATLVRLNRATGEIEPRLATSWTGSPDGLTWTLRLADGVSFSDGTPFTSADVVFTFQALFDERVKSEIATSLLIEGKAPQVRAVDASTVVLILPATYGPGLSLLDAVPILPRHKLQASLEAGTFREAWSVTTPLSEIVGLGPFVMDRYVPGERLAFRRNPNFWLKDDRGRALPYLDSIELQFVADVNTEVLRLQNGQADLTSAQVRFEDLSALKALESRGQLTIYDAGVSIAPDMMWFNLHPASSTASDRPWLQDAGLRQAISESVDRSALVNTVFLGEAVEIGGPITPGHKSWFASELAPPPLNRAAAAQRLSAMGLIDRNGDGMLDDARGRPVRFSLLTQKGHTVRERSAAILQEQLRQIGIGVDVVPLEVRTMIESWSKNAYDAIYFAIEFDSFDPARHLDFWLSSGAFHFWHPRQTSPATLWEASLDEVMRKQATTLDPAERRRLFVEAQKVLAANVPVLYFAAPKVMLATSARVRGATPSVLVPHLLWNAERLSVADPVTKR